VIGGGALGAATAFHLRRLGVDDVVLVERDSLASGSTSKSAGGIRAQFADELNIRIAVRSLVEFERMGDEISFVQDGYLFLLDNEADAKAFRAAVALQQSLGVPSQVLTPDEARQLVPQLEVGDIVAATFCGRDGHATPESVVQWYAL
jgi:sarcosine oxidase subunit beta